MLLGQTDWVHFSARTAPFNTSLKQSALLTLTFSHKPYAHLVAASPIS